MTQAIHSTRPGGSVGYVGVPHGVELDGQELFYAHVHLHGGPAPVRRYLPLCGRALGRRLSEGEAQRLLRGDSVDNAAEEAAASIEALK
jgi:threonine dehydrogenase-like Zn-dependent dehydrogenase